MRVHFHLRRVVRAWRWMFLRCSVRRAFITSNSTPLKPRQIVAGHSQPRQVCISLKTAGLWSASKRTFSSNQLSAMDTHPQRAMTTGMRSNATRNSTASGSRTMACSQRWGNAWTRRPTTGAKPLVASGAQTGSLAKHSDTGTGTTCLRLLMRVRGR